WIDDKRVRRCVVEEQHQLREQAVAAAGIDDATAAEPAARSPRHLPCFVELLAGQAPCRAQGPADPIEQRFAAEAAEVVFGQAILRGRREHHGRLRAYPPRALRHNAWMNAETRGLAANRLAAGSATTLDLVMLHGIYGRGRNWQAVARAIVAARSDVGCWLLAPAEHTQSRAA